MDVEEALRSLPPPDPGAPARVWSRFEDTRTAEKRTSWWVPLAGLAVAAVAVVALVPEQNRKMLLDSAVGDRETVAWSEHVDLTFDGTGTVEGTGRDVVVNWREGTLHAEVEPNTGTGLSVVTDEGVVRVLGTVFNVRRDALGVTTWVERGRVQVTCEDGWSGELTATSGRHTCLPTRPAMLLARATALRKEAGEADAVLEALELGLDRAPAGSPVEGELRALRMEVLADLQRPEAALADAEAYLAAEGPRAEEVRRFAAWLSLAEIGCGRALPYLEDLGDKRTAEDDILLAECIVGDNPARARHLVQGVSSSALEEFWAARARAVAQRAGVSGAETVGGDE